MKMLAPIEITDSVLISSSVTEDDYAEWSSVTAYTAGNKVIVLATHKVYEALQSGTNRYPPTNLTGTSPYWLDLGSTNRWRMLDRLVGSQTEDADEVIVSMECSNQGHIALLTMEATTLQVELYDPTEAIMVFDETYDLQSTAHIIDFYTYIFSPFLYLKNIQFPIPNILDGVLTVSLFNQGSTVKCGELLLGNVISLGCTNFGADIGIKDFSVKEADDFGNYSILQRSFSKTGSFDLEVGAFELDYIFNILSDYRSTPVLWLPTDVNYFASPTMIYGFYRDFTITLQYMSGCVCNLEIEGLL